MSSNGRLVIYSTDHYFKLQTALLIAFEESEQVSFLGCQRVIVVMLQ